MATRVKPSHAVRPGDLVTLHRGAPLISSAPWSRLPVRRGPASEAARCYEETPASRARREEFAARMKVAAALTPRPEERPDKHERRELRRLRGRVERRDRDDMTLSVFRHFQGRHRPVQLAHHGPDARRARVRSRAAARRTARRQRTRSRCGCTARWRSPAPATAPIAPFWRASKAPMPETVDPDSIEPTLQRIRASGRINLLGDARDRVR